MQDNARKSLIMPQNVYNMHTHTAASKSCDVTYTKNEKNNAYFSHFL